MKKKIKLTTDLIREKWLLFFEEKKYSILCPFSLIPKENERSLLWINSGVSTIKEYFNSSVLPPSRNLTSCQRVIRTDDINKISHFNFSYHQTLFEMLGCFSIGGNFKKETIPIIWDFFTNKRWCSLNCKKLFITVWENDEVSYKIWQEQEGIVKENILLCDKKENFWDIGNGPCGPNSEIYYKFDNSDKRILKISENKNFVEICNIVFPEFYNRKGKYLPLKEKCVDVGAGLERISMIIQKKKNNFQIDIWNPVINLIKEIYIKRKKENNN